MEADLSLLELADHDYDLACQALFMLMEEAGIDISDDEEVLEWCKHNLHETATLQ